MYSILRLSVQDAIVSTQQKLKLYAKVPDNGLVLFCGTVESDEGKHKKMTIAFEPLKPMPSSVYVCDSRFHTEVSTLKRIMLNKFVNYYF